MAMAAMSDTKAVTYEVTQRFGITTATLSAYINGDGSLKNLESKS